MSKLKFIRTWWGDQQDKWLEVPKIPLISSENEIVYVWGKENLNKFKERGYNCVLMEEDEFNGKSIYGKKLTVLNKALKEWGEVLMLDWDCCLSSPLDDNFYTMLSKKPIQVPLYAHHKEPDIALLEAIPDNHPILQSEKTYIDLITNLESIALEIPKYHWKWNDNLIVPNFGCVYSRDINLGEDLIKIAKENNIKGLVEEFAMWKYANCTLEEYIEQYHPDYVLGVSDDKLKDQEYSISIIQKEFNKEIKNKINLKQYFNHV